MNCRIQYHKNLLNLLSIPSQKAIFDKVFTSSDGLSLNATILNSNSKTGVIIVPGIWYPREAYYKLAADLSHHYKVMVYDQRGHSHSEGDFNLGLMVKDLHAIRQQYIAKYGIESLFIVGHSLGGYFSAIMSTQEYYPIISGQVLLAPPISLKSTVRKIPANLTLFKIYIMNLIKAKVPKYRGEMVKEYVSFWYPKFKKNPHLFAMRVGNPNQIVKQILGSIDLQEAVSNIGVNTLFLWGNNDGTLGIKGNYPTNYKEFIEEHLSMSSTMNEKLMQGMSHQFNYDDKRVIQIAGDNEAVAGFIDRFIEKNLKL